jgi:hypothetical protein
MNAEKLASRLDSKIRTLPSVVETRSRWKHRRAYIVARKEFAHFHGPNEIDVRLTKAIQKEIGRKLGDTRINMRQRPSDWITIYLRQEEDVEFAFVMVEQAWRANGGHYDTVSKG